MHTQQSIEILPLCIFENFNLPHIIYFLEKSLHTVGTMANVWQICNMFVHTYIHRRRQ